MLFRFWEYIWLCRREYCSFGKRKIHTENDFNFKLRLKWISPCCLSFGFGILIACFLRIYRTERSANYLMCLNDYYPTGITISTLKCNKCALLTIALQLFFVSFVFAYFFSSTFLLLPSCRWLSKKALFVICYSLWVKLKLAIRRLIFSLAVEVVCLHLTAPYIYRCESVKSANIHNSCAATTIGTRHIYTWNNTRKKRRKNQKYYTLIALSNNHFWVHRKRRARVTGLGSNHTNCSDSSTKTVLRFQKSS